MAHAQLQFRYEGRDRLGKNKRGKMTASSRKEVIKKLREQGIVVTKLDELKAGSLHLNLNLDLQLRNSVKFKDFTIFLRQFATLLEAGVSIVEATRILAEQTDSRVLRKTLTLVVEDLRAGQSLSSALAKHPKVFPPIFVSMIQTGEVSGNMDDTLERMAVYFEKQHHTRQKVKSALAYPIVIGMIAVVVVTFLLISVVPTFISLFESVGGELPGITLFVLGMSEWIQAYWWVLFGLAFALYFGLVFVYRLERGKYLLDLVILKIPLIGKLMQKASIARLSRTLASLLDSSVPILRSVSVVRKIVGNEVLARVMDEAEEALARGQPLSESMSRHWVFPPMVTHMLAIGEQTGMMNQMLAKIADFYEQEVEHTTDQLKSVFEPIMIVILALIVGTIVLAIFLPMFEMFNQIEGI